MRIAVGGDHRGSDAVPRIVEHVRAAGHAVDLIGPCDRESRDYPDSAFLVARAVADGRYDLGVLICGTGIGVCIAANKVAGVRAALVHDEITAQMSRSHNNANVICMSADLLGIRLMCQIVDTCIATAFSGGRHARRVRKIELIEKGDDPATLVE